MIGVCSVGDNAFQQAISQHINCHQLQMCSIGIWVCLSTLKEWASDKLQYLTQIQAYQIVTCDCSFQTNSLARNQLLIVIHVLSCFLGLLLTLELGKWYVAIISKLKYMYWPICIAVEVYGNRNLWFCVLCVCVWSNVCNSLRKNVWMDASEWMICEHIVVSFAFMYVCKCQLWK